MIDELSAASGMPARVAELWTRFRPNILTRVSVVEDAVVALLAGNLEGERRRGAEREAHKLAGSLGTFGFQDASRHSRSIELVMQGDAPLGPHDALRLSEWVLTIRREIEQQPVPTVSPIDDLPVLLLACGDDALAERVDLEAGARGFAVRRLRAVGDAPAIVAQSRPAALILGLPAPDGPGHAPAVSAIAAVAAGAAPPPIFVLTAGDGLAERISVLRRGARAIIRLPASPVQILDCVEGALSRGTARGASVLVLDDDPTMLELLRTLLASRGMQVRAVETAAEFWSELGRSRPDVVVLDVDMPDLDGIEICQAVRSDPRYVALPVLFLTGRTDAASVQAIFAAGADDYVAKPVVGPELLNRIGHRLERSGLSETTRGSGAGRSGRQRARERLLQLLHLATRTGHELAVAIVKLDRRESLEERLGATATDEVIRRLEELLDAAVPPGDVVASWGSDEIAVGMFAAGSAVAMQRLRQVLETISAERIAEPGGSLNITFSGGVAVWPDDGTAISEILTAAERTLLGAREAGGGRVLAYRIDANAPAAETIDVAVVEDDEIVAEMLLHALGLQGYTTRWISDGDDAMRQLTGRQPPIRPKVVVLDVDLPGRDGLSVLRALSENASVVRPKVLMLTVRSKEREVLAALELGASDHVAKPFSIPVLLRRVQALLDRG